ncbi:uncharacterized protein LOC126549916 isoform X2 [Aphis gossypii]|uniref:uncharacterized protein LOC126549916 isoform X2 n=1 Tax=Aphis gossypii TaxID=80765 RepID=UPI0021594F09|nr:uncharacterized protein LOC126549916 isoform X2 [Aphis gossypii]
MELKKYRKKCSDAERRELWMINCKTEYLADKLTRPNSYRVCEIHFENRMFLNRNTRTRLIYNAVPTIFNFDKNHDQQEQVSINSTVHFNDQSMRSFLNDHNYCKDVFKNGTLKQH